MSPDLALLTMPDRTTLETELRRLYPEPWVRHHLDSFSPAYFAAFTPEEVAQHLELIRALDDEQLVITVAWPADADAPLGSGTGADRWWVEVVGYDAFQFLSTLCNLLAVHGLSIVEGRVFTSQPPPRDRVVSAGSKSPVPPGPRAAPAAAKEREPDRRPKIVDRFLVRRAERRRGRTRLGRASGRAAGSGAALPRGPARRGPSSPDRPVRRGAAAGNAARSPAWSRST